jgi:drug/metabolite transporter (DMT)-like permease
VFSFNAAPTYFLTSLGFLMLLLMTMTLTPRSTAVISVLSFLPTAIFAASMVRFVFIALAASMLIALMTADRRKRKFIGVIIGVFLTAIMTGLAARSAQTRSLAELSLEESVVVGDDEDRSPSCNMRIDARNSIAIRRALAEDALF